MQRYHGDALCVLMMLMMLAIEIFSSGVRCCNSQERVHFGTCLICFYVNFLSLLDEYSASDSGFVSNNCQRSLPLSLVLLIYLRSDCSAQHLQGLI